MEYLLHALAGCMAIPVLHAAARGIPVKSLYTGLTGTMDLQALLALDDSVTMGYQAIQMDVHLEADCGDEQLDDPLAFARDPSPVCSAVCRPVPVTAKRMRAARQAA